MTPSASAAGEDWLRVEDPDEERTWLVDAAFLESPWRCCYGRGCPGTGEARAPERAEGCCSYGAALTGDEDAARVLAAAATLDDRLWQLRRVVLRRGGPLRRERGGGLHTRVVDGACAFLNRPGFPGGPGCALHRAALERGLPPLALKPDVCWQLPLRREDLVADDGHVYSLLMRWERRHFGPGGASLGWWCTDPVEAPEAFRGERPASVALAAELEALTGRRVAELIRRALDNRARGRSGRQSPLPDALPAAPSCSASPTSSSSSGASWRHQLACGLPGAAPHSGQGSALTS